MKDVQYDPKNYNPLYRPDAEIPTLQEWLAASSAARFQFMDRRGTPEIRAIDTCVEAYSKLAALNNSSTADLWQAAVNLLAAVEVYLATPRGHKQQRLDAVYMLKRQTDVTLARLRWKKLKEVTGGYKPGMKPMVQHVWSEMHSPGHARVGHDPNAPLDPDEWLTKAHANPDPGGSGEKYLFEHLRKVRAEENNPDNVLYIEDSEKWKYQVVFSGQGLACERNAASGGLMLQESRPITTSGFDNLCTSPYAVDEDGVFYTQTSNHGGGILNHCSFLSGRPVMCAGNIGISNGIVGYIDNGSGHYRPSVSNLVRALKALQDQVSPLHFGDILVRNHAGANPLAAYSAPRFLNTSGHCLPVGYYKSAGQGTHYRSDLVEFADKSEIPAFLESQDQARNRAKAEKDLNALLARLQNNALRDKDGRAIFGKLSNDDDRRIMQEALKLNLGGGKAILSRYYAQDQPMLDWEKRQTYGVAVKVASQN